MALEPWSMGAVELATAIRTKKLSGRAQYERSASSPLRPAARRRASRQTSASSLSLKGLRACTGSPQGASAA